MLVVFLSWIIVGSTILMLCRRSSTMLVCISKISYLPIPEMRWVDALFSFIDIMLLYLPPYSPDLNPIEESFSTCVLIHEIIDCDLLGLQMILLGKSYIRRNAANLQTEEDPILM